MPRIDTVDYDNPDYCTVDTIKLYGYAVQMRSMEALENSIKNEFPKAIIKTSGDTAYLYFYEIEVLLPTYVPKEQFWGWAYPTDNADFRTRSFIRFCETGRWMMRRNPKMMGINEKISYYRTLEYIRIFKNRSMIREVLSDN